MKNLVLIGNYGVGNLGDEMLREYFEISFANISWSVVSASPKKGEYGRLPCGIRSWFQPWWRTIAAIRASDGVVFGGGTLFTDAESIYACFLWWWHAMIARFFGKKTYFAFQGVGPWKHSVSKVLTKSAFRKSSYISVRDIVSKTRVESLGLNKKIIQSFDPVLSLILDQKIMKNTKNVFTIIPRNNSGEVLQVRAQTLLTEHTYDSIKILSLMPSSASEKTVCKTLKESIPGSEIILITTPGQLVEEASSSAMILSHRYHGSLTALALGVSVEVLAQKDGDKHSQLQEEMQDIQKCIELVYAGADSLSESFI